MSGLLKEVLALTVKSEAALWKTVEQKILNNLTQLARPDIVQITHHFGVSKQGTNDLWSALDKAAVHAFPELSVDETLQLIDGFGQSPDAYALSHDLNKRLSVSWEQIGKLQLQKLQEQDPYTVSEIVKQLDAAAPESIRVRASAESKTGGFLNLFGVSSTFNKTKNDTYSVETVDGSTIRSSSERETFIQEQAEKYLKENSNSQILDIINSK